MISDAQEAGQTGAVYHWSNVELNRTARFPDVAAVLGKAAGNTRITTPDELCDWLLEEHGVATVPGTAFGAPTSIRLSFAASEDDIKKALTRIASGLSQLS